MDKNNLSTVSLVVSLATLVLVAYTAFFGVASEIEKTEALKVGGKDNYKLVKTIYSSDQFKSQQSASLLQAVQEFQNGSAGTTTTDTSGTTTTTPSADGFTRGTLTQDQIAGVLDSVSVEEGNADSNIVLIEYSDIECPFCQRHFTSKTVETVVANNDIKTIFKHFPLSFHPNAQKAGEAIECAAKDGKGLEYKNALFAATVAANGTPTQSVLLAAANTVGLDEADFSTCLNSGEMADQVTSDMNEGSTLFGVSGTPGNVVLNTETGKYVVIAGAYPADQFTAVVNEIK